VRKLKKAQGKRLKARAARRAQCMAAPISAVDSFARVLGPNITLPSLNKRLSPVAWPSISPTAGSQDIGNRFKINAEHLQQLLKLLEDTSIDSQFCQDVITKSFPPECGRSDGAWYLAQHPDQQDSGKGSGATRHSCVCPLGSDAPRAQDSQCTNVGENVSKSGNSVKQRRAQAEVTNAKVKQVDMTYKFNRPFKIAAHAHGGVQLTQNVANVFIFVSFYVRRFD
jgi:hypothetical protein